MFKKIIGILLICFWFANMNLVVFANEESSSSLTAPYNIDVGVTYSQYNIDYNGDNDYFKFTAPVSGEYSIYTTGSTDTYGYLLNSSGSSTYESNDDSGAGTNFKITLHLSGGQSYMVRVKGYYNSTTGSYSIRIDSLGNS